MPAWVTILTSIGGAVVLYGLYAVLDFLALHFWLPSQPLRPYARPGRAHALITGASAGIGLGIAQELVRQGFGVVLLGHLASELAAARAYLERDTPGAAVRVVVMDAITATPADLEAMVHSLSDLDMTILVNNVGGNPVALPPFRAAATYSADDVDRVLNQNARFMARLTPLFLRAFARAPHTPTQRCLVLTLGSGAQIGLPWLTLYGGTKAFNVAFSQGLAREVRRDPGTAHVDCLAVVPGDVRTQGNCHAVGRWDPGWEAYGRCVVRTVDGAVARGRRSVTPYWLHDVQYWVLGWLDEGSRTRATGEIIGAKREAHNADVGKRE